MGRRQPPDLPSMLLSARVVYLGMPVRSRTLFRPCWHAVWCWEVQPGLALTKFMSQLLQTLPWLAHCKKVSWCRTGP